MSYSWLRTDNSNYQQKSFRNSQTSKQQAVPARSILPATMVRISHFWTNPFFLCDENETWKKIKIKIKKLIANTKPKNNKTEVDRRTHPTLPILPKPPQRTRTRSPGWVSLHTGKDMILHLSSIDIKLFFLPILEMQDTRFPRLKI